MSRFLKNGKRYYIMRTLTTAKLFARAYSHFFEGAFGLFCLGAGLAAAFGADFLAAAGLLAGDFFPGPVLPG